MYGPVLLLSLLLFEPFAAALTTTTGPTGPSNGANGTPSNGAPNVVNTEQRYDGLNYLNSGLNNGAFNVNNSRPSVVNNASSGPSVVNSAPSVVNSAPSGPSVVNSVPSVVNSIPSEPSVANSAPSGPSVVNNAPGGPSAVNSAPSGPSVVNNAPSGPSVVNFTPGGPSVVNNEPSGPSVVNSTPSGPSVVNSAPNGPSVVNSAPSGPSVVNSAPSGSSVVKSAGYDHAGHGFGSSGKGGVVINKRQAGDVKYNPDWQSLDTRPRPNWYDKAKIGIAVRWGLFSVPSFGHEYFFKRLEEKDPYYVNFMNKNYPTYTYQSFAPLFTADFYNPQQWVSLVSAAGARYVVFTAKSDDGFSNWRSLESWNWNTFDVGPKRDLIGEFRSAVNSSAPHLRFGVHYSLTESRNPLYMKDKESNFATNTFITDKVLPQLTDLVTQYKPDLLFSDNDQEAPDTYFDSTHFLAWLFNESPVKDTVVVNDRWGKGTRCKHGSYFNCDDRYNPGSLKDFKFENSMSLDEYSYSYRREAKEHEYHTTYELLVLLVTTVSCGGNLLITVGPTHDGRIPPITEHVLRKMGKWLNTNGVAVYETIPWNHQVDSINQNVWYTSKDNTVYAFILVWPENNELTLGSIVPTTQTSVKLIGYPYKADVEVCFSDQNGVMLELPLVNRLAIDWIWVLEITNVTKPV